MLLWYWLHVGRVAMVRLSWETNYVAADALRQHLRVDDGDNDLTYGHEQVFP